MATAAQITSALTIQSTFDILNASNPINFANWVDATDWAALGYSSGAGDTVKIISQTIDPVGQYPYQNAGYQTDSYASPDTTLLSLTKANYNLFTYSGTTNPIWGGYSIMVKVEVTPNGLSPIYVTKTFLVELAEGITPTLVLQETNSCTALTYTSQDATNYGFSNYLLSSIVRTHTVYPPAVSGQSNVTGDFAKIILGSPDNPLWNATYEAKLSVVLTYTQGGNTFITHASTTAERAVSCTNDLCALACCLNTLQSTYTAACVAGNTVLAQSLYTQFLKCTAYYNLIQAYLLCGQDPADLITQFYVAGKPYCDCNCNCDTEPGPAVASNILQGPAGPTGPQGPTGPTGAGAAGPAGANAAGLLLNDNTDSVTVTDDWETWAAKTATTDYTNDAKNLVNVGDQLKVYARFKCATPDSTTPQSVRLTLNGSVQLMGIFFGGFFGSNQDAIEIVSTISKLTNTTCSVITQWRLLNDGGAFAALSIASQWSTVKQTLALLNTSTTNNVISAYANDNGNAVVTCEAMSVEILKVNGSNTVTVSQTRSLEFLIIAATTTYTFDGTVTAYNTGGINLIGKSVIDFILDGLSKSLLLSEYTFDSLTGIITIPLAVAGAPAKIIYQ